MLTYVTLLCMGMMGVAAVLNVYRLVKGPDIPDRVLALDTLYITSWRSSSCSASGWPRRLFEASLLIAVTGFVGTVAWASTCCMAKSSINGALSHALLARTPDLRPAAHRQQFRPHRRHRPVPAAGLHHAPARADQGHHPGVGSTIIASMLFFSVQGEGLSLHELLIALFLFITAPVSAHMLARAAIQQKVKQVERTDGQPWR